MERTLAKMVMLAEVESLNSEKLKQIAEIFTMNKGFWSE
jgi:hypothetical protein